MNQHFNHLVASAIALATWAHSPAFAQADAAANYPSRAVTIVVPFPPGGGTDVGARLVAQKLSVKWGQPVVIDNKGGAAGMLGADVVAKAKPDGYTLLVGNVGTQSVNPALYKKMSYDPDTAFAPVSMIAELPLVLLVNPGLPFKTVKDLVAQAKAEPGKLSYASSGSGGAPHLATEILQKSAGISLLHVPYKGGGPAVSDLMAGHVNMLFATVLESIGHVKSGKLRGLAVSSASRSPALPDMPTVAESGIAGLSGFDTGSWIGMLAPAGTPQVIVDKLSNDVREVLKQVDTRQTLINQGATPLGTTPAAFKARIDADRQRYGRVIHDSGITVE
jgi:tripartite-type tricarboxylate transporter receptor subunit TctC